MDTGVTITDAVATFIGFVTVYVGYGWYLSTIMDCISYFRRQVARSPARRILLPYAVVTLFLNSAFVLSSIVENAIVNAAPSSHAARLQKRECSPGSVLNSVLIPLVVSVNDTLFLYRASVLFGHRLVPMIVPYCLYLAVTAMGLTASLGCAISTIGIHTNQLESLWSLLTGILNVVLASMITWKLVQARRSLLRMGMDDPSAQYITTVSIVIESSLLWVISIVLVQLADVAAPGYFRALRGFFRQIFQIMPMISPAMLLHRVAHNMHYSPSGQYTRTTKPKATLSPSDWLDQTEKQLVGVAKQSRSFSSSISPTVHLQTSTIQSPPRVYAADQVCWTLEAEPVLTSPRPSTPELDGSRGGVTDIA